MKTAEEIADNWPDTDFDSELQMLNRIKQIKLDAYRAGGLDAAEIAGKDAIIQPSNDAWQLLERRKEAILTHFNNPKLEIPK